MQQKPGEQRWELCLLPAAATQAAQEQRAERETFLSSKGNWALGGFSSCLL